MYKQSMPRRPIYKHAGSLLWVKMFIWCSVYIDGLQPIEGPIWYILNIGRSLDDDVSWEMFLHKLTSVSKLFLLCDRKI